MPNQIAFGFLNLMDLAAERVTEVGVDVVNTAIEQSIQEYNRQLDALIELFAERTTDFKTRFKTPIGATLQPLDDNGRARPIKPMSRYDVAFPLYSAGSAWGANHRTKEKMTVKEANDYTMTLIGADIRWLRNKILATLFANASFSFTDELHGTLTVKGLANNDGTTYQLMTGGDIGQDDDHYSGHTGGVISDAANPFPALREEISEHPENGDGEVVVLVPTNQKAAVESLSGYLKVRDPNVSEALTKDVLVGDLGISVPGKLIGYVSECWIVEWKHQPNDYLIALSTSGERALKMREEPEESLQGFNKVAERNDHPFYESQYLRYAGFGAWNRVGAAVKRVNNAAYAVPANYASPMA